MRTWSKHAQPEPYNVCLCAAPSAMILVLVYSSPQVHEAITSVREALHYCSSYFVRVRLLVDNALFLSQGCMG